MRPTSQGSKNHYDHIKKGTKIKSRILGHNLIVEFLGNDTYDITYADTGETFYKNSIKPCKVCGKTITDKGHDPCIKDLPWVKNACCGHGDKELAYIAFSDGQTLRGEGALKYFKSLKGEQNG